MADQLGMVDEPAAAHGGTHARGVPDPPSSAAARALETSADGWLEVAWKYNPSTCSTMHTLQHGSSEKAAYLPAPALAGQLNLWQGECQKGVA